MIFEYTKTLKVNLFEFAYRLFHEDFSPINSSASLSIEHSTTCDDRINLNYMTFEYFLKLFSCLAAYIYEIKFCSMTS